MREAQFTNSVGKLLPVNIYRLKLNCPYTGGVPDAWYSGTAGDLWVEYKYFSAEQLPKKVIDLVNGKDPILSKLQQSWLRNRHSEGRNVAVVVGFDKKHGLVLPGVTWDQPITRDEFLSRMIHKRDIAQWITQQVNGA
jgi:hypothetical protein